MRERTIAPLPLRHLATAHPETVDTVFRKILRKPGFNWVEHGETLLHHRKTWYYEQESRPGVSVIGNRLSELVSREGGAGAGLGRQKRAWSRALRS